MSQNKSDFELKNKQKTFKNYLYKPKMDKKHSIREEGS